MRMPRTALALGIALVAAASAQGELGLTAEEDVELQRMLRRGELRDVLEMVGEVLTDAPDDAGALVLRAQARFELCEYEAALADAGRAVRLALSAEPAAARARPQLLGDAARAQAYMLVELGRAGEALEVLESAGASLDPRFDTRAAWSLGRARMEAGQRASALDLFRAGARAAGPSTWQGLLARGRCERALGFFERAARSLVEADKLAGAGEGVEPDVLVELGDLYFEVYGEVDNAMTLAHLPSKQYREALSLHKDHEGARLGLFRLYRFNWALSREDPSDLIRRALEARPDSIPALLASLGADLDDGRLSFARATLERLEGLAPRRRDVRSEAATLAWVEHERDAAQALLAELAEEDPGSSDPEVTVARHLNEVYRFAEALPFAERACERAPKDWRAWQEYARSLANVGREAEALEAFERCEEAAEGRRNAWRSNVTKVLGRIARDHVEEQAGEHTFVWREDAAQVLRTYLVPFYAGHREGLAERYGHTPGPVRIEVFRSWDDFSVRSTGFRGFPALGVCFGPVVTSVSPLCELRGGFSWARTAYHEYTHVIHLSLSHNRCPRWITEGLATWEEEEANQAWSRNMRGDLLNAHANGDLIPVRELNRAFRTSRVLFAYYQGGLLCRMLIDEVGFSPMIRLLLAFDRGLDLDEAFDEVLRMTPEEADRRLEAFVSEQVSGLAIEPVWSPGVVVKQRIGLSRTAPSDERERAQWADGWLTVAWGSLQQGRRVDAEQAAQRVKSTGLESPRYLFLRGELGLVRGENEDAREFFERGLAAGGEDFRVRMTLAEMALGEGEFERAEAHLLAAERAFPGIAEPMPSAELKLAELYAMQGRSDEAMEARRRWLSWDAGDVEVRLQVAAWMAEQGRHAESEVLYREANEVDPFSRALHKRWGISLAALGRDEEALREFDVALITPAELDRDLGPRGEGPQAAAWDLAHQEFDADRPELLGRRARALLRLGRLEEARSSAEQALALDEQAEAARGVLEEL